MINKKNIKTGILSTILILFLISSVSALAVSFAYWAEHPLEIFPGQTTDIKIVLQNMVGEQDINVKAEIITGSEIIELIDESDMYFIPFKTKKDVNIRVNIPKDAKTGEIYNAKVRFTSMTGTTPGTFGFGSSIEKTIPIVISGEEKEVPKWVVYLIIGIILLMIIIYLVKTKKIKFLK